MKKTYMIPSLNVVKVQSFQILSGSVLELKGTTSATSGNLGREGSFSDWDDEE